MDEHKPAPFIDAPLPEGIARAAENLGVKKAHYGGATLFALAVLAGAFIGLGAMIATLVVSGADGMMPFGVTKLLGGFVFSLGLILVLVGGAQLFTGDMLMVMAWASGKLRIRDMVRVWTMVWLGNFVGAAITAVLVFLSGQYMFGHGAVGATAVYYAVAKTGYPPFQALVLGILCNVLVCLAVWLSLAARSVTDKVLAIVFPVTAFVAAGFEHCVANMYYVPMGLLIQHGAPAEFWHEIGRAAPEIPLGAFIVNLLAVTAGNWIGGAILVGAIYWFIYLRPRDAAGKAAH
ncbi:formate/nitrite transporter family protein [Oleisolibacter albus]|uniref:formate/nitrite transporter family protein n=1 Tax=Oleisolibacter albus TaxID=2171757 RepID=UPI000DF13DF3|nr:formate/nitrite transporter family protein [Oleisolibacter albus]